MAAYRQTFQQAVSPQLAACCLIDLPVPDIQHENPRGDRKGRNVCYPAAIPPAGFDLGTAERNRPKYFRGTSVTENRECVVPETL
jgi:hypothetical protein